MDDDVKTLIRAEMKQALRTQAKTQLGIQLIAQAVIQGVTWLTVFLLIRQINNAVQTLRERVEELPDELQGLMQDFIEQIPGIPRDLLTRLGRQRETATAGGAPPLSENPRSGVSSSVIAPSAGWWYNGGAGGRAVCGRGPRSSRGADHVEASTR